MSPRPQRDDAEADVDYNRCVFGTRASLVVDLTFVATLLAPFVTLYSFRAAKRRSYDLHRRAQAILVIVCFATVIALEVEIRLAGGAGAFLGEGGPGARVLMASHIIVAVLTYIAWAYLAIISWRRFNGVLPGSYSRMHKKIGKLVFGGLCFSALSAIGMYTLAFVL